MITKMTVSVVKYFTNTRHWTDYSSLERYIVRIDKETEYFVLRQSVN